jgi:hypothetical protein
MAIAIPEGKTLIWKIRIKYTASICLYNGNPVPFVIKTMEEIDLALGGIADNPHRHNYYTIIWPVNATGKHFIDFREYQIQKDHIFL